LISSVVEPQRASAVAAAEVAPQAVRQRAVELVELAAAVAAKLNEPAAEAPRPSFSSTQGSLPAARVASLQAVESAAQPLAAVQPRAALVVESVVQLPAEPQALVARLKLNSTRTPRSCRDRNSAATALAVRER